MRGGDFSQLLTQRTPVVIKDPLNNQPFPNNVIPSNRISSVSQAVNQSYLPAPNRGGADALASNFGFTFRFRRTTTCARISPSASITSSPARTASWAA